MTHSVKLLMCCLAGGLAFCGLGAAGDEEAPDAANANPYQSIVDRNVFGLKPPPPPPDKESEKPPMPKITLTGITTVLGKKLVFLKTPPPAGKPGEPPKSEQYYMIKQGERDGDIEVLDIDEKAGVVKINFAGTPVPLNFTDNGVKTAPVGGVPGQPPGPGGIPAPVVPGQFPTRPLPVLPGRQMRIPTPGNAQANPATYQPGGATPAGTPGITVDTAAGQVALPSFGTPTPNPTGSAVQPQNQLSPEVQYTLVEANRLATADKVAAGLLPPLPPTPLTPAGSPGSVQQVPVPTGEQQAPPPFRLPLPHR